MVEIEWLLNHGLDLYLSLDSSNQVWLELSGLLDYGQDLQLLLGFSNEVRLELNGIFDLSIALQLFFSNLVVKIERATRSHSRTLPYTLSRFNLLN